MIHHEVQLSMEEAGEYQRAVEGRAFFDACAWGTVEVAGPDAPIFLHNLSTNDIKNLRAGEVCEAFLTTQKAKIIAHVRIARLERDGDPVFWLGVEPGLSTTVFQHLDRHLISERVELVDRSAELGRLRVFHRPDDALPTSPSWLRFSGLGFNTPVTDLVAPTAETAPLQTGLENLGYTAISEKVYDTLRIEAGLPRMGREMDDARFVVEIDRNKQAISYSKGCYLGQEPIVMARDRGQVNRLLRGVVLPASDLPAPGAVLFRGENEVGKITSVAYSPRLRQAIALAFLRRGSWEPGTEVFLEKNATNSALRVTALPFSSD